MMQVLALLLAGCGLDVAAAATGMRGASARRERGLLSAFGGMRPELVARSLAVVEEEWKAQAGVFVECNVSAAAGDQAEDCTRAPRAFGKSCSTVVGAVLQASSGDRSAVTEYMGNVCGEPILGDWQKEHCRTLAQMLSGAMSEDTFDNRERLDVTGVCHSFWSYVAEEERAAAEQRRAEAEKQHAELEKQEQEDAEVEAKRRKEEEARKAAAEAAARLAEKAEAERTAAEADRALKAISSAPAEATPATAQGNATAAAAAADAKALPAASNVTAAAEGSAAQPAAPAAAASPANATGAAANPTPPSEAAGTANATATGAANATNRSSS